MQQVFLESRDLLKRMSQALWKKEPFSLVRVGDGENLVLSQDTVWPVSKVLEERWAIKASKGQKGLYLPNIPLRDAVAASIRNASVVGILPYNDDMIKAPDYLKRPLTDQVFRHFDLSPPLICHAGVNRELAEMREFWRLLKQRRILIVTREAEQLHQRLEQPPYSLHIVKALPFDHWGQYRQTIDWITSHAASFDIALFSCGVNAVVLAERTMALTGKIALDFGKAANIVLKGRAN
ncbi:GT-D fold domain-containing glycosyltransferase [Paenibacillus senegalimassiliensis]|uniref:GT-D fold domain-containing glycosyltransferase n=1 Tax=Paenibacillus senegalimassiliensis TaxID=1737426 RepID=UPI00073F44B8|nr:GT-D fold domain-containing glycosyltransferase [Paenibacillus senegalimassiliensis]